MDRVHGTRMVRRTGWGWAGVVVALWPHVVAAQARPSRPQAEAARSSVQQSGKIGLTDQERIRARAIVDSVERSGACVPNLSALAEQLVVAQRYVPDAGLRIEPDSTPLRIIAVSPDTALAGEEIEIVLSCPLGLDQASSGRLSQLLKVAVGPFDANVQAAKGAVVRIEVPDGAKRGTTYAIRAVVRGNQTAPFEGFVAGPPWSATLRRPGFWVGVFFGLFLVVAPIVGNWLNKRKAARQAKEYEKQLAAQRQHVDRLRFQLNASGMPVSAQAPLPADDSVKIVVPDVPNELIEMCAGGDCLLVAGLGLSQQAKLPSSVEVLAALMERTNETDPRLREAMNAGRYDEVAEVLAARLPRETILSCINELYAGQDRNVAPVHKNIARIPFVHGVSTAWDSLLETAFKATRVTHVVTPNRMSKPVTVETSEFTLAKPFGSLADPDSFRFTDEEMLEAVNSNRAFGNSLAYLVGTKSVFFVGTSSRRIQDFLHRMQLRLAPNRPHFALLPRQSNSELQDEILYKKFGIQVIGFDATAGFPEVAAFVKELADAVERIRPVTAPRPTIAPAVIREVRLTNIGPFQHLELKFGQHWNVLLGNNGSGKSTLLRAIALGMCGEDRDAEPYADKLLRSGAKKGEIELVVGDITYRSELFRDDDKVRVKSQLTAFLQGRWVVLAFPPLRGVSTRDPAGVAPSTGSRPVVGDLLPLIKGSYDERLNDLKQWIVNLDVDSKSSSESRDNSARLLKAFFELLRKVTPGVTIEFAEVSRDPWRVVVQTEDGKVPIDQVSQGMSSIFGWVGTMLQRMYEIHGKNSEHPEKEAAVVLVDELEAHLHPEWQQKIVALVREFFPNLQIIATSHSPLVVVGMQANEVYIARRDRTNRALVRIEPVPPEVDFASLRADQILTSDLFGLSTTRGPEASRLIEEYTALRGKSNPTGTEKQRIAELRDKLLGLHGPEENPARRQVTEAVTKTLREMVDKNLLTKDGEIAPELAHEVRQRLDKVMMPETASTKGGGGVAR